RSDKVSKELIEAAQCGNPEWISKLVEDGANIDYRDRLGKTALHHAAEAGKNDALSCLLTLGADTEAAFQKLISYGAPVNKRDKFGFTPLLIAAVSGSERLVKELLQAGADPNL
ncbi:ankyrin, partial [Lojkania enalia]